MSKTCALTIVIGDQNDSPIWTDWGFNIDVMENTPPKTVLGTQFLQVHDPESDQIEFSIESVDCGGGVCDWFEIGSCDGKLRVKAGAAIAYSPGLDTITLTVKATDSGGLRAVYDATGAARASGIIKVTVLNLAEPPVITGPTSFSVDENIQGNFTIFTTHFYYSFLLNFTQI